MNRGSHCLSHDESRTTEGVAIRQTGGVSLKAKCFVGGTEFLGVIDTAAEVTVMSWGAFRKLNSAPDPVRKLTLRGAGVGQKFEAVEVGPVKIELGDKSLNHSVYVGNINDDLLIGIDVLKAFNATIDMGMGTVECRQLGKSESKKKKKNNKAAVARLKKPIVVPPVTEVAMPIEIDWNGEGEFMEFLPNRKLGVTVPRAVHRVGMYPMVNLINLADNEIILPRGTKIGKFHPLGSGEVLESDNWEKHVRVIGAEGEHHRWKIFFSFWELKFPLKNFLQDI